MHYGSVVALQDASFVVNPKEVVGLLGPNGAGKSTTMKILTTYLWPTSGTAKICGKDVLTEPIEVRRQIGYLPEVLPLYDDMEVRDYVTFVARARGLHAESLSRRIDWVVERCGLRQVFRTPVRALSKGFRQRTGLAQALIHDPEVIVLDEPTSGLDPHQILEIRKLVRELAVEKTVVFSTHILNEVEMVADRIVIVSQGVIVADGTLEELRMKAMKRQRAEVVLASSRDDAKRMLGGLMDAKNIDFQGEKDGKVRFRVEADHGVDILKEIGDLAREKKAQVSQLHDCPFTLEETFLALTEAETAKV
jgi:ABC-2 type transport system ATP-binding protein